MMRRAVALLCAGAAGVFVGACESTAEKSAQLAKHGATLAVGTRIDVTKANAQVVVVSATPLTDANGTAAAVALRNTTAEPLYNLPISVIVLSPAGKKVAGNDAAGLDPSLTHVAVLPPGQVTWWVDDQLFPTAKAAKVKATVGKAGAPPPTPPAFPLSAAKLVNDPTSGVLASGTVRNATSKAVSTLTVEGVSLKGGTPIAAGRGAVSSLAAGATSPFRVFFIGKPTGGQLVLTAAPTGAGSAGS
jgi:hypothetical protein